MMPSNVALTTLALRPMAAANAFARSASMPSTVLPSLPMNSLGAYDASAATVSVPLDLIAAGTPGTTFFAVVLAGCCAAVVPPPLSLLPHPAARIAASASASPAVRRANFVVMHFLLLSDSPPSLPWATPPELAVAGF